jgi:hypothetical protein
MQASGFGDAPARFRVYLAAPPAMEAYQQLSGIQPLQAGEIDQIYRYCGNGWRKIFNVYAKLLFALPAAEFPFAKVASSWQQFRDGQLLQAGSGTTLCFSAPQPGNDDDIYHLIAGRTLAKQLLAQGLQAELHWLSPEFAVDPARKLLVTPFFDYRQLNNEKIVVSAKLLQLLAAQVMDVERYALIVQHQQADAI